MNKSSKQYYRKLTTNSYNQDFIYYKHLKQPSKSPRFKKNTNNNNNVYSIQGQIQIQPNHSKIQSMKNTLNTLFDPSIAKINSKSYNKSVVEYPTYNQSNINKKNILNINQDKNNKNIYDQININSNLNSKLQILTSKLRSIAQKPHFTSLFFQSQNNYHHNIKNSKNCTQQSQQLKNLGKSENLSLYIKNTDIINKLNDNVNQISSNKNYSRKQQKINKNNTKNEKQKDGIKTDRQIFLIKQGVSASNKYLNNYSHELRRSKSKSSSSFYQKKKQLQGSISQTTSLKRYPKQLKNDKSISIFHNHNQQNNDLQFMQRPRGKTTANLLSNPMENSTQSAKIKINSYVEESKLSNSKSIKQIKNLAFAQSQRTLSPTVSKKSKVDKKIQAQHPVQLFSSTNICTLNPHRAQITSIIINSDGRRFLTTSSDYTVKQSTIDGKYSLLRKHQGRVNIMRMIDDHLFTGGNDCKVRYQGGMFNFNSSIKQIYSHQKQFLNVATSSTLQLFNVNKNISSNKVAIKTHFYKLQQKINKQVYFLDNHNVSIIDWRVPYPLINLYSQRSYVDDWLSDPYSLDFYQIQDKNMILVNSSKQKIRKIGLNSNLKDYCWKKDKIYLLTQNSLQIFQNKKNQLNYKISYEIDNFSHSHLQIKNNMYAYGTLDGKLVINSLI